MNCAHLKSDKLRAGLARMLYVFACSRAWRARVLTSSCVWHAYLHAHVLTCVFITLECVTACLRTWFACLSYLLYISIFKFQNYFIGKFAYTNTFSIVFLHFDINIETVTFFSTQAITMKECFGYS